jgi:electron transfer flavoprotein alpha subunit
MLLSAVDCRLSTPEITMPKILIVAEQAEGQLKRATLSSVTFAREEISKGGGGQFAFVVVGQGVGPVAEALKDFGAEKIYTVDGAAFANYTAEAYAPAV